MTNSLSIGWVVGGSERAGMAGRGALERSRPNASSVQEAPLAFSPESLGRLTLPERA